MVNLLKKISLIVSLSPKPSWAQFAFSQLIQPPNHDPATGIEDLANKVSPVEYWIYLEIKLANHCLLGS